MSSHDKVKAVYAGDSYVNQMYVAFSQKDHIRWGSKLGRLFQAVVEAEIIHAQNHLQGLSTAGSSLENSKEAKAGEYEFEGLYLDHTA